MIDLQNQNATALTMQRATVTIQKLNDGTVHCQILIDLGSSLVLIVDDDDPEIKQGLERLAGWHDAVPKRKA